MLLGLPDWVFAAAAALVVVSMPLLVVTGHAEWKRAASTQTGMHRWLSWRRLALGAGVAFGGLGAVTVIYMAMRLLGIGPVGTLMAAGVLDARDPIILAEWDDFADDPGLARTILEVVRMDLGQSPVVTLIAPTEVGSALRRMEQDPAAPLSRSLALEIAQREGIKAVVTGEVHAAGAGYVLSAQVLGADETLLAGVRATARDSTALLDAIEDVSAKLRERIGESLRTIRASPSLSHVTTASLPALRSYTEALRVSDRGDDDRAIVLLQEAVGHDSSFAMAYRKLGIIYSNRMGNRQPMVDALGKAFEHRDRLTPQERLLTEASYYSNVTGEPERAMAAYEGMLESDPRDAWALNNMGVLFQERRDYEHAADAYRRSAEADSTNNLALTNLGSALISLGEFDAADSVLSEAGQRFPGDPTVGVRAAQAAYARGELPRAWTLVDSVRATVRSPYHTNRLETIRAFADALHGRSGAFDSRVEPVLETLASANVALTYLVVLQLAATYDAVVRSDAARARARLEAGLEAFDWDSIPPVNRRQAGLAVAFALAGDPARARRLLEDLERSTDPGWQRVEHSIRRRAEGYIALSEGRLEDAIAEFRRSDTGSCRICPLHGLGIAYELSGHPDSAIAVFERFVSVPSATRLVQDAVWLADVYQRLGRLHEGSGNVEQALDYYDRLVSLWEHADAELQPVVADMRRRMARLAGERPRS
jgi:tetratricopeptide (TPR) repeat protein